MSFIFPAYIRSSCDQTGTAKLDIWRLAAHHFNFSSPRVNKDEQKARVSPVVGCPNGNSQITSVEQFNWRFAELIFVTAQPITATHAFSYCSTPGPDPCSSNRKISRSYKFGFTDHFRPNSTANLRPVSLSLSSSYLLSQKSCIGASCSAC